MPSTFPSSVLLLSINSFPPKECQEKQKRRYSSGKACLEESEDPWARETSSAVLSSQAPQHLLFRPHAVPHILCPFSGFPLLFPPFLPPNLLFFCPPHFMQDWGFLRDPSSMERISSETMKRAREKERGRRPCCSDGDTDAGNQSDCVISAQRLSGFGESEVSASE